MTIVHRISLDFRNVPLSWKKKAAIDRLKQGEGYSAYVLKMDGTLLKYGITDKNKQGWTVRTLQPSEFKILG